MFRFEGPTPHKLACRFIFNRRPFQPDARPATVFWNEFDPGRCQRRHKRRQRLPWAPWHPSLFGSRYFYARRLFPRDHERSDSAGHASAGRRRWAFRWHIEQHVDALGAACGDTRITLKASGVPSPHRSLWHEEKYAVHGEHREMNHALNRRGAQPKER